MDGGEINRDVDIGIVVAIASIVVVFSLVLLLVEQRHDRMQGHQAAAKELVLTHVFLLIATATLAFGAMLDFWLAATLVIAGALGGILTAYLAALTVLDVPYRWPIWALLWCGLTAAQCVVAVVLVNPLALFLTSSLINGTICVGLARRLWPQADTLDMNSRVLLTLPFVAVALAYLVRLGMVAAGASATALVQAGVTIAYVLAFSAVLWVFAMMSIRAHRLNQSLDQMARLDPLTGLENRYALAEFSRRWADDQRLLLDRKIICACIDLDYFKQINDTHGHAAGDYVLQEIGQRLRIMPDDTHGQIFRIGGDEFVLWQEVRPDISGKDHLQDVLCRLRQPIQWGDIPLVAGASIGFSEASQPSPVEELMRRADAALYRAKADGRGVIAGE